MNIITADFNWISFVIIIVATIIGMVKSNTKKQPRRPDYEDPDYETEDGNVMVGDYTNQDFERLKVALQQKEERGLTGDYYAPINEQPAETSLIYKDEEDENEETHTVLDIRQAIISSEILHRPQF